MNYKKEINLKILKFACITMSVVFITFSVVLVIAESFSFFVGELFFAFLNNIFFDAVAFFVVFFVLKKITLSEKKFENKKENIFKVVITIFFSFLMFIEYYLNGLNSVFEYSFGILIITFIIFYLTKRNIKLHK